MSAKVITITSGKGGVGKTTVTANVATALALLGKRVVAIDSDIGLRNLDVALGLENRIIYDLVDVVEGRCRLRNALVSDLTLPNLQLIPASQTRDKMAVTPSDMVLVCDHLRQVADYIVIDSPAGIERGFRNAVVPADQIVVVTNPAISAVRDADRIIGLIEKAHKPTPHLVLNRVRPHMITRGDMLSVRDVLERLKIDLLGVIPEDETVLASGNHGIPVVRTLPNGQEASVSTVFHNIARRLDGEVIPFIPLSPPQKSFLMRFMTLFSGGGK